MQSAVRHLGLQEGKMEGDGAAFHLSTKVMVNTKVCMAISKTTVVTQW